MTFMDVLEPLQVVDHISRCNANLITAVHALGCPVSHVINTSISVSFYIARVGSGNELSFSRSLSLSPTNLNF